MEDKPKTTKLVLKNKSALIRNTLVEIKKSAESNFVVKNDGSAISSIVASQIEDMTKVNKRLKTDNSLQKETPSTKAQKTEISTELKESSNPEETKAVVTSPSKKPYLNHTEYNEILDKLIQKYPNAFSIDNPKILAIGIDKEIKADKELDLANKKINYFLARYCRTTKYRALHTEGAERHNLQGEISGQISEAQATKIKELQDKYLKRSKEFIKQSVKKKNKPSKVSNGEVTSDASPEEQNTENG